MLFRWSLRSLEGLKCHSLVSLLVAVVIAASSSRVVESLHLKGSFNTNEFFKFLTRFGIQSTDMHDIYATRGYIYGNITLVSSSAWPAHSTNKPWEPDKEQNSLIMLTVMDYNYFIDYYNKRRILPHSVACPLMFEKIDKVAYFFECNENGTQDFIRRAPCPDGRLCVDEDNSGNVISGYQFTFTIQDLNQPRFWYISLVSCVRDKCQWGFLGDSNTDLETTSAMRGTTRMSNQTLPSTTSLIAKKAIKKLTSYTVYYDIWLVNGDPSSSHNKRLEHQFSYEHHDIFEIYLYSFCVYVSILPFIVYRLYGHFHYLYLQLAVYVGIELTSRLMSLIHNLVFAYNGQGVYALQFVGEFVESIGGGLFIFIIMVVARGWTIRSRALKISRRSYFLGFALFIILVISHMVSLLTVNPVFNNNNYETVAGYVEVGVRLVFMIWFIIELNETSRNLAAAAVRNTKVENQNSSVKTSDMPMTSAAVSADTTATDSDEIDFDENQYEIENQGKKYQRLNSNKSRIYENFTIDEKLLNYQKFYLHYGACSLVWFINLPVIIFVTSFVSELSRPRLVLSIRYFVNFISVLVLIYIMWSPKTPLKLPGKKPPIKYDINNLQYLISQGFSGETNLDGDDDNDDDVVYSAATTATTSL